MPYSSAPFFWEEPTLPHKLNVRAEHSFFQNYEYCFDSLQKQPSVNVNNISGNDFNQLHVTVFNDGPTSVFRVSTKLNDIPILKKEKLNSIEDLETELKMIYNRMNYLESEMEVHRQDVDVGNSLFERFNRGSIEEKSSGIIFSGNEHDYEQDDRIDYDLKDDHVNNKSYLYVDVFSAKDLMAADFGGTSDPFAIVKVGKHSFTTEIIDKTLNPLWNAQFSIPIYDPKSHIHENVFVSVYDKDLVGSDFLGFVDIPLSSLFNQEPLEQWFDLKPQNANEKVSGQIKLRLHWVYTLKALNDKQNHDLESFLKLSQTEYDNLLEEFKQREKEIQARKDEIINKDLDFMTPVPIGIAVETQIKRASFKLFIDKAEGLFAKDENSLADPYLALSYGAQKETTKSISSSVNPVWDTAFTFTFDADDIDLLASTKQGVCISVYDEDPISVDEFMGELMFDIDKFKTLPIGETVYNWYPIHSNLCTIKANNAVLSGTKSEDLVVAGNRGRIRIGFSWNTLILNHEVHKEIFSFQFPCFGVSLMKESILPNSLYQIEEIIYLCLTNFRFDFIDSSLDQRFWCSVDGIQVDSPAQNMKVLLFNQRLPGILPMPQLQIAIIRDTSYDQVFVYHYISILLQCIHLNIEIDTILDIYSIYCDILSAWSMKNTNMDDLIKSVYVENSGKIVFENNFHKHIDDTIHYDNTSLLVVKNPTSYLLTRSSKPSFFQNFQIHPILIVISFHSQSNQYYHFSFFSLNQ